MKKSGLLFLTVCTFVLNILASQALAIYPGAHGPALKEFHEGFRELRWGDSLSDFTEERILVKTDGLGEYYSKIHEDLQFGGVKVKQIIYGFNESHYLRSVMIYAEPDTFFALKKYLYNYLGKPMNPSDLTVKEGSCWVGFGREVWLGFDKTQVHVAIANSVMGTGAWVF